MATVEHAEWLAKMNDVANLAVIIIGKQCFYMCLPQDKKYPAVMRYTFVVRLGDIFLD